MRRSMRLPERPTAPWPPRRPTPVPRSCDTRDRGMCHGAAASQRSARLRLNVERASHERSARRNSASEGLDMNKRTRGKTGSAAGSRLGAATPLRGLLNRVFPDHWSFLLGEIALYSFVVLVVTGTFLALFFD